MNNIPLFVEVAENVWVDILEILCVIPKSDEPTSISFTEITFRTGHRAEVPASVAEVMSKVMAVAGDLHSA